LRIEADRIAELLEVQFWEEVESSELGRRQGRRYRSQPAGYDPVLPALDAVETARCSWWVPQQPPANLREADRASLASPAEGDLPDSSQHGNSSHPPRRMRAVQ
jgi:hypothetical protein